MRYTGLRSWGHDEGMDLATLYGMAPEADTPIFDDMARRWAGIMVRHEVRMHAANKAKIGHHQRKRLARDASRVLANEGFPQ